ncbi:hypothetical protein [Pseudomonas sp. URMO17WK12:I2]|uniref:hypothetical protein n=1 Tax=Pseudomonas sp. URMO17WK12:I2 TaxID=1261623 RepID=UPI000DAD5096|nr:hypothetical protein [Pseudomonas sp. URMO17WK12:I2]PZW46411.1 hypothetical protein F469_02294 [Pseudomonas sp. URMO17WK12:I2]
MQNQQTPQWLELFTTAFGAKGLVALAWWAGAYHAERIRNLQGTYPILHLQGGAGSGKSTLVSNLWRLSGEPEDTIFQANATFAALISNLAKAVNRPVVVDESERPTPAYEPTFEACYQAGTVLRRWAVMGEPESREVSFRGALAVVGGNHPVLRSRSIALDLDHSAHTADNQAAVKALYALHISDLSEFLTKVQQHQDMAVFCMGKAEALAFELADQVGIDLNIRDARNHAQLIALLDFLDTLFNVPATALESAKAEVRRMAWQTVGRTRGLVED